MKPAPSALTPHQQGRISHFFWKGRHAVECAATTGIPFDQVVLEYAKWKETEKEGDNEQAS